QLINALIEDRKMVLRNDSIKAVLFITFAAGVIWLYLKKKIKPEYAITLWVVLILFDMWPVDRKYLNAENFSAESSIKAQVQPSAADIAILKDKNPDYRVLNLTVNPFSDASTSYFHKSIGGYNGAKMKRYQELIDYHISPEINKIIKGFKTPESLDSTLSNLPVLNMLNAKYIIYSKKSNPLENNYAAGNAWFVKSIKTVPDAQKEINALGSFDPKGQVIVDKRYAKETNNLSIDGNDASTIVLKKYQPNRMEYDASVKGENGLAVFSEIWYPKGWNVYIDGKKANYFRADYVLRAMVIPSGNHKIVFKFEPSSYFKGNNISRASSIILLFMTILIIYSEWKRRKKNPQPANK
ncbi:MAG: YfhO family protein, partial [Prolixibacteraceae bacterium]|nr:YfhO family protein [Prolixibacteraceae bacterium]